MTTFCDNFYLLVKSTEDDRGRGSSASFYATNVFAEKLAC